MSNDQQLPLNAPSLSLKGPLSGKYADLAGHTPIQFQLKESLGHLVLRGLQPTLAEALQATLNLELPCQPLTSFNNQSQCIRWVSPDEWLLTLPINNITQAELDIRTACQNQCAVVDVSGGQTVIEISGAYSEMVLQKSIPYDLHLNNLPVGKVVTVALTKSQCLLRRLDTAAFELVIRRSFADYLWAWLTDASKEFGYQVRAN